MNEIEILIAVSALLALSNIIFAYLHRCERREWREELAQQGSESRQMLLSRSIAEYKAVTEPLECLSHWHSEEEEVRLEREGVH